MSDTTTDNKPVNGAALKGAVQKIKEVFPREPKSFSSVTAENFPEIKIGDLVGGMPVTYASYSEYTSSRIVASNGVSTYVYSKPMGMSVDKRGQDSMARARHYDGAQTDRATVFDDGATKVIDKWFMFSSNTELGVALAYDFLNGGTFVHVASEAMFEDPVREYRLSRIWPDITEVQLKQSDFTKFKPGDIIDMGAPWVVVYSDNVELQLQFGLKLWRYLKNGSSCEIIRRAAVLQEDSL